MNSMINVSKSSSRKGDKTLISGSETATKLPGIKAPNGTFRLWFRLGSFFFWVLFSVVIVVTFERNPLSGLNMIWVANGLILSFLLLVPRNRWAIYLLIAFAALFAGDLVAHKTPGLSIFYDTLDCIEVLIIAFLLRPKNSILPEFTSPRYVLKFFAIATLLGPLISATLFAAISHLQFNGNFRNELLGWFESDALGIAVATPACIAILLTNNHPKTDFKKCILLLSLIVVVTFLVFHFRLGPTFPFIFPLLLLLLLKANLRWAGGGVLLVTLIGGWCTLNGNGPFALYAVSQLTRSIWLQVGSAACMAMLYAISFVMDNLRNTEFQLKQTATLHNLVIENLRDVIILSSLTGVRTYVSSGAHALTGFEPKELIGLNFIDLAHPQDRAELAMVIKALQAGSNGGTLEYRVRKRNGEYFWVEANLRVYSEPGSRMPAGILNLVRDISDRKRTEQQLQESYRAVEALAIVDALTGAANRRRFDEFLNTEWRRRMRTGKSISLIMIDVDSFKLYNDTYGHVRGDSCLKQIAEAALDVVGRPGDLVARYGGEEFAVILPDTDLAGTQVVASEICNAVSRRCLRHEKNKEGIVTVSLGYATMVPQRGMNAQSLLEAADKALYQAKLSGKNRAVGNHELVPACGETPSGITAIPVPITETKTEAA